MSTTTTETTDRGTLASELAAGRVKVNGRPVEDAAGLEDALAEGDGFGADDDASPSGVPIPADDDFGDGVDFLAADLVGLLVRRLVRDDPLTLAHLARGRVLCLWQRAGGKAAGMPVWARAQRPGKLYRHLAEGADFFLLLAADNLREADLTDRQFEALVYSKLCEMAVDPETGRPAIRPPDFVGFVSEVQRYGFWSVGLRRVKAAVEQIPLGLG